jgi:RimJ/RimL family protein N-acetyltransferase
MTAPLDPHPAAVPPGYPREYERELRLPDGRRAMIRPIVPEDRDHLAHAIRTADPETLYSRFLDPRPHITPALLTRLSTVDYRKRLALVAADARTGAGVAIARYEETSDGTADVAVAVDPAWRRVGLATALVEMLAEAALDRGIHTFSAYYLAENRPVTALLDLVGRGRRQSIRQGFAEAAVALNRADVAAAVEQLRPGRDADRNR